MNKWRHLLIKSSLIALFLLGRVYAQDDLAGVNQGPALPDDCVTQAASYHSVNSWILRGIIQVESSFNPNAVNNNRNGTFDIGIAQINSMHFKELSKHGIAPRDLMDACVSSYVAAWHLRKQVRLYGNTWFAVGAYTPVSVYEEGANKFAEIYGSDDTQRNCCRKRRFPVEY